MKQVKALAFAWLVLACGTAAFGQIHGVPATVTSVGRVGSFPPGPAPSVTSLGPMGWSPVCCASPGWGFGFGQPNFVGSPFGFHHRHHGFDNRGSAFGTFYVPLYIPYYPYVPMYSSDVAMEDPAAAATAVVRAQASPVDSGADFYSQPSYAHPNIVASSAEPAPAKAPAPTPQDPTVLVFLDGHRVEVHNYAIVGKTLYSFDSGTRKYSLSDLDLDATRKVNDDLGNEFHVPGQ
jgi:hypothetical protein